MSAEFQSKLGIDLGFSEYVSILTILSLSIGLTYKYGYFTGLGVPWYLYTLSINYILLSTLIVVIALAFGGVSGYFSKVNKLFFTLSSCAILTYIGSFLITVLAYKMMWIDQFSTSGSLFETTLNQIQDIYLSFSSYSTMYILGFVVIFYSKHLFNDLKKAFIVLCFALIFSAFVGYTNAQNDLIHPEERFNQVIMSQSEAPKEGDVETTDENYFLVESNEQYALILIRKDQPISTAQDIVLKVVNIEQVDRIIHKVKEVDDQR